MSLDLLRIPLVSVTSSISMGLHICLTSKWVAAEMRSMSCMRYRRHNLASEPAKQASGIREVPKGGRRKRGIL